MCISLHIQTPRNVFKKRHHFCMICDEMLSHVFDLAFLFILWITNEFENVFEKWCVTSTPYKSGTTTAGTRCNGPSWSPNSSTECLTRNDWRPQITGCTKDRSSVTEQKTIRGGTIITHSQGWPTAQVGMEEIQMAERGGRCFNTSPLNGLLGSNPYRCCF